MTEKRNILKYYIRYILYSFAGALVTGGIIQSFMLESGISAERVSLFTSITQITQAVAMILLSPKIEKTKNMIRKNALAAFGILPLLLAVFLLCVKQGIGPDLKYFIISTAGILAYIAYAVIGIFEYKLPYQIINMDHYGTVVSIAGMCIGVASLCASSLYSFLVKRFDYFKSVSGLIFCGIIFLLFSIWIGGSYKPILSEKDLSERGGQNSALNGASSEKKNLFRYPPFVKLFFPNLFRGYATGTFGIMTTVGYYYGIIDAGTAGIMAILSFLMVMIGCLIYARMSHLKKDAEIILISSVLLGICMIAMMVFKSPVIFIILYAAGTFIRNMIDYACPVALVAIVDYEWIGQFSSWRLALYMAGGAIAGVVLIPMLELFGGVTTMAVNALAFFIMGIGYYICTKR